MGHGVSLWRDAVFHGRRGDIGPQLPRRGNVTLRSLDVASLLPRHAARVERPGVAFVQFQRMRQIRDGLVGMSRPQIRDTTLAECPSARRCQLQRVREVSNCRLECCLCQIVEAALADGPRIGAIKRDRPIEVANRFVLHTLRSMERRALIQRTPIVRIDAKSVAEICHGER